MKKILITGATGFIGRNVIGYLLQNEQYSLIATSIEDKETAEKIFPLLKQTTYAPKNLNDKEENYFDFFGRPDIVIHLSWEGLPNYYELFHIEKNLSSNFYFIKNLIVNGLKDISLAGTCFEYGLQNACLKEDMPTYPTTPYGLAKDTLRKFIEALRRYYDFSMKWVRIFYPYGDGQAPKSLWSQMKKAVENGDKTFNMSQGDQLRDYLPIKKVAEYIAKIATQNEITGIINCCSGKPLSVKQFVENFFAAHNYSIQLNLGYYPYPDYEPMEFWGDVTKLNKII
ncbi:MAG: NAD(P)-dependent oxidoreductase [Bacteroidales bacterium]|jgi:dTDP-6-deoxy-L-talose 4-dehydrogenase (NAD+)|nr:NAD(P)-dependent oxidoreductase [Bacteroidales bacterium]